MYLHLLKLKFILQFFRFLLNGLYETTYYDFWNTVTFVETIIKFSSKKHLLPKTFINKLYASNIFHIKICLLLFHYHMYSGIKCPFVFQSVRPKMWNVHYKRIFQAAKLKSNRCSPSKCIQHEGIVIKLCEYISIK